MNLKLPTVLLRVDASQQMGTGHLVRCFALASALENVGLNPIFICTAESQLFVESLNDSHFRVHYLPESLSLCTKALVEFTHKYQTKLIVLDGYHFKAGYRKMLADERLSLIAIDDNNDLGHLYADIIINPSVYQDNIPDYASQQAKVLAGELYRLLRPVISEQMPIAWSHRSGIGVIMGGSDPRRLTLPVTKNLLSVLKKINIKPDVEVIIGAGVEDKDQLISNLKILKSEYPYLTWCINPTDIGYRLGNKHLVLTAAGGTQFELYALATPAILLVAYDNQFMNSQIAEKQGWAKVVDVRHHYNETLLAEPLHLLLSNNRLMQCHQQMSQFGDEGALNAAIKIKQAFFTMPKFTISAYNVVLELIDDTSMALLREWRNQDAVRYMMRNTELISQEQHQAWYQKIKHLDNQQHFIVKYKGTAIGCINIRALNSDNLNNCLQAEVGLYIVHPKYKGNIVAFAPSLAINDYAFNELGIEELASEVKADNVAAVKYNQQLGYQIGETKQGFTAISMSADNYNQASVVLKRFLNR